MKQLVITRFHELVALKERREERKITQSIAAEETGLSMGTIHRWMHNRVDRFESDTLVVLCNWLECEVGDLLVVRDLGGSAPNIKTPMLASA